MPLATYVHRSRNGYSAYLDGFPFLREQNTTAPAAEDTVSHMDSQNRHLLVKFTSNLLLVGVLLDVAVQCYWLLMSSITRDNAAQHLNPLLGPFLRQLPSALLLVPWLWVWLAIGTNIAVFYVVTDDLVLVCRHISQQVAKIMKTNDVTNSQRVEAASTHCLSVAESRAVQTLNCVHEHVVAVMSPHKSWFTVHMTLISMSVLMCCGAQICLLFTEYNHMFLLDDAGLIAIYSVTILLAYLIPLCSAARVTASWDKVVSEVMKDSSLLCQSPQAYLAISEYLRRNPGGFIILGQRIQYRFGLQAITMVYVIAGLARYLQ